jgi:putative transposase
VPRPLRDPTPGIRHITCRGNRRQAIFLDDRDRRRYLDLLQHVCGVLEWRVLAWCLMTNHVHLVVAVPGGTISKGMQLICGDYGQEFNWRHGLTGHLFQGRFRAEPVMHERYLFELARYVDLNPERAGVVSNAKRWNWSSCRAHLNLEPPRPFHDPVWIRQFGATTERAAAAYARYLEAGRQRRVPSGHGGV